MSDTSIRVSEELADELYRRKGRSTSYEDYIWQLLNADREGSEGQPQPTANADSGVSEIQDVLGGWNPDTEADAARAREETIRAAEWLRETGARQTRSAFVDALAGDVALSERGWWERHVQPGLRELAREGLVEQRDGHHDYYWLG